MSSLLLREANMLLTDELETRVEQPGEEVLRLHARYRGKTQIISNVPIGDAADLGVWYTPGVAVPCRANHHERQ